MTQFKPPIDPTLHLISTGADSARLDRLENGFRQMLEPAVSVSAMRLGIVNSLRVAYYNAARLIDNRDAILLFAHQDVVPVTSEMLGELPIEVRTPLRQYVSKQSLGPIWWQTLQQLLTREDCGFAGVAGSREMTAGKAWWQNQALSGMVMHRREEGIRVNAYGPWTRALVVDGLCMICRASTLLDMPPVRGDQGHFHFYDMDLCLNAHARGLSNWTIPL
ncbi:MAG TPA: hypothetical protein ENH10_07835, partial [Bacteroidetes bacterium]|nr:hypothetical protein [Bacteroidota bacterium]HEX05047.1 hypothetical protein [Bacteroidota bacterium]